MFSRERAVFIILSAGLYINDKTAVSVLAREINTIGCGLGAYMPKTASLSFYAAIIRLFVKGGVGGKKVARIEMLLHMAQHLAKALVVNDLALSQEADGVVHVRIVANS